MGGGMGGTEGMGGRGVGEGSTFLHSVPSIPFLSFLPSSSSLCSPLLSFCKTADTSRLVLLSAGGVSGGLLVGRRYLDEIGRPRTLLAITMPTNHRRIPQCTRKHGLSLAAGMDTLYKVSATVKFITTSLSVFTTDS